MKIIKKIILMVVLLECTVIQTALGQGWWPFKRAQDPIIPATLASKKKRKDDFIDATLNNLVDQKILTESEQSEFIKFKSLVQTKAFFLTEGESDDSKVSELVLGLTAEILTKQILDIPEVNKILSKISALRTRENAIIITRAVCLKLVHTKNQCAIKSLLCNQANFKEFGILIIKMASGKSKLDEFLDEKVGKKPAQY